MYVKVKKHEVSSKDWAPGSRERRMAKRRQKRLLRRYSKKMCK